MISYSERVIQDHQLDAQEAILEAEIVRAKLEMSPHSAEKAWALLSELNVLKQSIGIARKDLHEIPVRKRTVWDRLRIRVYMWAAGDRFL